jgi:squalene synthase HpnC
MAVTPTMTSSVAELERIAAASAAKMGTENFPVALRILPARFRDHLRRAYAFARFVDDVGDEAAGDRLALLDAIDRDLCALSDGAATLLPVQGLTPLLYEDGLSRQPLHDLVAANRRDQTASRYQTFEDLLDYCRLSAVPIGRIVLAIAHVEDPGALLHADRVCMALQVLEHCQDVGEDAVAGRVYLPVADLEAAGVRDRDLYAATTSPELRRVVAQQVQRSIELLASGQTLVRDLRGPARVAVLGYAAGGRATAHALRAARYDVLRSKIAPRRLRTAREAATMLAQRRP